MGDLIFSSFFMKKGVVLFSNYGNEEIGNSLVELLAEFSWICNKNSLKK